MPLILQSHLYFERPLDVGGRTWTLSVAAAEPVVAMSDKSKPWIVLGAGLIISGLIGAIGAFQAVARAQLALSRAALAEEVVERKKAQEAADMANSELIHRVKNTLAVVSAIAFQTGRYSSSVQQFNLAFRERLAALGRAGSYQAGGSGGAGVGATDRAVACALSTIEASGSSFQGRRCRCPRTTSCCSVWHSTNQQTTNAIKYGAWSIPVLGFDRLVSQRRRGRAAALHGRGAKRWRRCIHI